MAARQRCTRPAKCFDIDLVISHTFHATFAVTDTRSVPPGSHPVGRLVPKSASLRFADLGQVGLRESQCDAKNKPSRPNRLRTIAASPIPTHLPDRATLNSWKNLSIAVLGDSEVTAPAQDWAWVEPTTTVAIAIAVVFLCILAWGTNLIALPGNWISVAILALYVWLGPGEGRAAIGGIALAVAFGCALIGEVTEFIASALGAKRAGASRKSTIYAVIGSMIGAITGGLMGVPIPIIGSVLAAILFGGIGATAGAMYGEWTDGKSWKESWAIGHAAFWGRTFGTLGKVSFGFGIVLIAVVGVLL